MTKDEKYWADYDGLQQTKHAILKSYLDGWFPILSSVSNQVLYIDCHAGRGRHITGQEGSPIIALKGLVNHRSFNTIIQKATVNFIFFERNENNYQSLQKEIEPYKQFSSQIHIWPYCSDYESSLTNLFTLLHSYDKHLPPCFAFLDPFGFDLSMETMNTILSFPKSEIFINFMYRYINMAIMEPPQEGNMNNLFGSEAWLKVRDIKDPKIREEMILGIFTNKLKAKWVTQMRMLSSSNTTKYILIHATNHSAGRDLMKQVMWKVSPEGSFAASEKDNPNQLLLLTADPNLAPLKKSFINSFQGQSLPMEELYQWLRGEMYLKKHLHQILRECRDANLLDFSNYTKPFSFNQNPQVNFLVNDE